MAPAMPRMTSPGLQMVLMLVLTVICHVAAQDNPQGCGVGQPMYAGDWAQKGVRVSLVKTGNDNACSRYVTLEMVDDPRFHSNPYADSLAVIVNFPPGPALVVSYEMGKRVYNITLQLPQLPCDASPSCADYIGSICQQQGVGFYYQLRMKTDSGCDGGSEFIGIRDGETFNAPQWNFQPDPASPCMPGNSASYDNIDDAVQDIVAWVSPHPTLAGNCVWKVNLTMAPNQKFRDSDYIDMVSFRGAGQSNYGAGTRMFFKGQQMYTNTLPGPANCADKYLDVELVLLNEFLGAYPNYQTGKSTCPFFSFKRYQFNNNQHYSYATGGGNTGGNTGGSVITPPPQPQPGSYPSPTDAACTTPQSPQQLPCPAMLSTDEVRRGFGAYYDATCQVRGGSWAVYTFPGGQSCCRTCRWNKQDAVAAWLQPTELDDCPPCVKAYYEAARNGPVDVVPLAPYVSDVQCPYPKPSGGDMTLPSWIYSPETGKCYYKSSFAKGISNNINDAIRRCTEVHGGQLVKVSSAAEDDFIRLNLLWTGFFGETYTGLRKLGRLDPAFTNTWNWYDGSELLPTDYQRWSAAPRNRDYVEDESVCMEYLPQQPKTWNPFACTVNKHYICERPATNPVPVGPPGPVAPGPSAPVDCSTMPAMPQGAVAPVALINAGGPAMCNYFAADTASSPVATGGAADNWVGRDPACQTQRAACSVRFGGAFSYTINTVPGRNYLLRFTFTEVWWGSAGQRQFDILLGGITVLPGVDPYALAGAKFTPAVREVTVTAGGPNLVVGLQSTIDNAALGAIEVFDMGVAPTQPSTTPPAAPVVPPSPSPAPVVTPSPSPAAVVTPSPSPAPVVTPSPSPSPSPVVTPSPYPAPVSDPTPSPSPAAASSPSPSQVVVGPVTPSPSPAATQPGTTTSDTSSQQPPLPSPSLSPQGPTGSDQGPGSTSGGSGTGSSGGSTGSNTDSSGATGGSDGATSQTPGTTAGQGSTPSPSPSPVPESNSATPSLLQGSSAAAGTSTATGTSAAQGALVRPAVLLLLTLLALCVCNRLV